MNEMFSILIGASESLNCDRVRYILLAGMNEMFSLLIVASRTSQL